MFAPLVEDKSLVLPPRSAAEKAYDAVMFSPFVTLVLADRAARLAQKFGLLPDQERRLRAFEAKIEQQGMDRRAASAAIWRPGELEGFLGIGAA
jgi:hypothetical protein